MANAIVLVDIDEKRIKVVLGKILKVIPFNEVNLSHNKQFLAQLFQQSNVLQITDFAPLSLEEFSSFTAEYCSVDLQHESVPTTTRQQVEEKPKSELHALADIAKKKSLETAKTQQTQQPAKKPLLSNNDDSMWFVSTVKNTIIVDDFETGETLTAPVTGANGVAQQITAPKYLSIKPGYPIDLSKYDQLKITKSRTIKNLITKGSLIPCTEEEVNQILENTKQEELKLRNINKQINSGGVEIVDDAYGNRMSNNSSINVSNGRVMLPENGEVYGEDVGEVPTGPLSQDEIKLLAQIQG